MKLESGWDDILPAKQHYYSFVLGPDGILFLIHKIQTILRAATIGALADNYYGRKTPRRC